MLLQTIRTTAIAVGLLACGLQGLAQAQAPAPANPVAPLMVNGQALERGAAQTYAYTLRQQAKVN